jgi:hypothetical protein
MNLNSHAETATQGLDEYVYPVRITIESIFRWRQQICDQILNNVEVPRTVYTLSLIIVCASALYGFTMGIAHSISQAFCAALKVPMLFYLTLVTCLPTLHFIGLLLGSKVRFTQTTAVLLWGIAITSVLLGAFAPISLFFLVTGSTYNFLMIMHVLVFTFCGAAGLYSINSNFNHIREKVSGMEESASRHLLSIWMALYMFVGTQMAYVLAPFVGRLEEFVLFRPPDGNFYSYMWDILQQVFQ